MSSPADELVEEVDEHGDVVRVVTRAQMRAEKLRHRCVYIVVLDSADRLLVHQRAATKDVYPSFWDVAAGGVCGAGESWQEAARRELAEELGVDATLVDLGGASWAGEGVAVVGRVFAVRSDGPFTFSDGEVVQARFVTAAELDGMLERERFCPDSIAVALPKLRQLGDRLTDPRLWDGSTRIPGGDIAQTVVVRGR